MLNRKSRHSKNKSVSFQMQENNFTAGLDKTSSNGSVIVEEGEDSNPFIAIKRDSEP